MTERANGPLVRLIYISRNLLPPGRAEAELQPILAASRRRNAAAGVTGALMVDAAGFAQVLEGPLPAVEQVFEPILRDPRHDEVVVLEAVPVEHRSFPAWAMAHAGDSAEAARRFAGLLGPLVGTGQEGAPRVRDLLRGVLDRAAPALAAE
ncbi:MAG TPA: BLUF domain-containing protein [Crenalkalicoccus sp.]|nr:BLUF domain-containing protein [Crenalkalicoccus sp.]